MPLSRRKACLSCSRSKLRCNRLVPTCSRCKERNLHCVYENQRLGLHFDEASPKTLSSSPQQETLRGRLQSLHHQQRNYEVGSVDVIESSDVQTQQHWFEDMPLDQDTHALGQFDFSALLPAPQKGSDAQDPMNSVLLADESSSSGPWFLNPETANMPLAGSTDVPAFVQHTERALLPKQQVKGRMLSAVILGQLTSFPKMMMEGDRLPPFIHAPCHVDGKLAPECSEKGSHQCLPGDLAMCQSLVRMYYSRSEGSAGFVWRLVYAEHDRIRAEYHRYDLTTRLRSIQTLLIFLLMQAEDTSTIEDNDTNALLNTVLTMTVETSREKMECYSALPAGIPDREDWLLLESIRRVIAILFVVGILLHGVFIPPCTGDGSAESETFAAHPLPCGRDLWEARTSTAWRMAYKRWATERRTNQMLKVRDVLGATESNTDAGVRADVMKWCQNLDGAGMLIWTVLPLHRAISNA